LIIRFTISSFPEAIPYHCVSRVLDMLNTITANIMPPSRPGEIIEFDGNDRNLPPFSLNVFGAYPGIRFDGLYNGTVRMCKVRVPNVILANPCIKYSFIRSIPQMYLFGIGMCPIYVTPIGIEVGPNCYTVGLLRKPPFPILTQNTKPKQ
jgi:hypothetical protein